METAALVFFFVLGLIIATIPHVSIPLYLAATVIRALFPSFKDSALPDRWHEFVLAAILGFFMLVLLHNFGIDPFLEVPTWAPWVPESLHSLYHTFVYPWAIGMFVAKIICTLLWRRSPKKVQETEPRKAL